LLSLLGDVSLDEIQRRFGESADVMTHVDDLRRYFDCLEGLGVLDWVTIDLKIVRGLAYYTGIVFELFDAKGELRAICGGGRIRHAAPVAGGVDLPALGFRHG
jgi:histidyl-tRNA synthetase